MEQYASHFIHAKPIETLQRVASTPENKKTRACNYSPGKKVIREIDDARMAVIQAQMSQFKFFGR